MDEGGNRVDKENKTDNKELLAKCKPMRPIWVREVLKNQEQMIEEYKNRRFNYFIKIAKGDIKVDWKIT